MQQRVSPNAHGRTLTTKESGNLYPVIALGELMSTFVIIVHRATALMRMQRQPANLFVNSVRGFIQKNRVSINLHVPLVLQDHTLIQIMYVVCHVLWDSFRSAFNLLLIIPMVDMNLV